MLHLTELITRARVEQLTRAGEPFNAAERVQRLTDLLAELANALESVRLTWLAEHGLPREPYNPTVRDEPLDDDAYGPWGGGFAPDGPPEDPSGLDDMTHLLLSALHDACDDHANRVERSSATRWAVHYARCAYRLAGGLR